MVALLAVLLLFALGGCSLRKSDDEAALEFKRKLFHQLRANLELPLAQRIQRIPADLLADTQAYDRSLGIGAAAGYAARTPSDAERSLVMQYIDLLPPTVQRIFQQKLLAIYLVDGFAGAGLTDWVTDGNNQSYYYLIFNSVLLEQSLDAWLSYKDNSLFDDSAAYPVIQVRTQTPYKALLYGLLHEGAHVVDYELGITPFVETLHRKASQSGAGSEAFSSAVWAHQDRPLAPYDFPNRAGMNVYRLFTGKPLVPRAQLPAMYAHLRASPFASFYSASTWNEHLADFFTYHHIEQKLGGTVHIELVGKDGRLDSYAPSRHPVAGKLAPLLEVFYR